MLGTIPSEAKSATEVAKSETVVVAEKEEEKKEEVVGYGTIMKWNKPEWGSMGIAALIAMAVGAGMPVWAILFADVLRTV